MSIDDPMTQLSRLHEWMPSGRETVLGPQMLALVDWIDSKIVEFAIQAGATELPVPRSIDRSVLERGLPMDLSSACCLPERRCYLAR